MCASIAFRILGVTCKFLQAKIIITSVAKSFPNY